MKWYASLFTGLFNPCGPVPPRPHDPAVCVWAGTLPHWGPGGEELAVGGAGWDAESAEGAGVGEGVERWLPAPLPSDHSIETTFASWPLDEPAIPPDAWVLFHPEQYATPDFPFSPFTLTLSLRWSCCRSADGEPYWVPEEFLFLAPRPGERHRLGPTLSTGLASGRQGDPVLLRGLQEVTERDALMGLWWGRYPLEEHDPAHVLALLPPGSARRLLRPNLRYRCYRIATPFSAHVAAVTLEGEDHEGFCFSVGSACRETRAAAWEKAFLEAVQGRYYVRHLLARGAGPVPESGPTDFAQHALFYSLRPDLLARTPFHHPTDTGPDGEEGRREGLPELSERLGPGRPVLSRHLTPPALLAERLGRVVLRVLVPGLQPMHGHHGFPFLGGPLWAPRGVRGWDTILPHAFP